MQKCSICPGFGWAWVGEKADEVLSDVSDGWAIWQSSLSHIAAATGLAWWIDFKVSFAQVFPKPHGLIFEAIFKEREWEKEKKGDPKGLEKIRNSYTFQTVLNKHHNQSLRKEMLGLQMPIQTLLVDWGYSGFHKEMDRIALQCTPRSILHYQSCYCLQEFLLQTPNSCQ